MKQEMNSQLLAKSNTGVPFYEPSSEKELKEQTKRIEEIIEVGHTNDFISDQDLKAMKPSGKSGRLYGNPKCHKGIKEGRVIPPCRPIISGSGSITEKISKFVDYYAQGEMKKI